jgi:Cu+-exporting ATPase
MSEPSGAKHQIGGHGSHAPAPGGHAQADRRASAGAGVRDPVCGMTVDPHTTAHRHAFAGHAYYFCCAGCQAKFAADPRKYLGSQAGKPPPAPVPQGAIYTCPMHPEIRQSGPGSCPICGMALEPMLATAQAGPNPELVDMTRRLWIGLVLAVPVVALEMGGHLTNLHMLIGQALSNWIQLVIATPVVLWAGWPFFVRGWTSVVTRNLNMFTLIAMGTGVAWTYSGSSRRRFAARMAPWRCISRRPRSSPCWCCSARSLSCAPASRPRERSARCSISRPRRRGV